MQSILNNPYRICGLLVGTTAREQIKQVRRLKQYLEVSKNPSLEDDFSFPVLGKFNRSVEAVTEAESKLNLDSDKMNAALFWFYKGNEITDEPAFDALKTGDVETACQIWHRRIIETTEDGKRIWKAVSAGNFSAFHNYFVLETLLKNGNRNTAIVANLLFLESNYYLKLVNAATDTTYKTTKKDLQLLFLNEITKEIENEKAHFSLLSFIKHIKNYDFVAKQDFLKNLSLKFTDNINSQIDIAQKQRIDNKQNAATAGENLYKNTQNDLKQLKEIFGEQDFSYSNVADKVANEVLQCGIDYYNHYRDTSTDPGNLTMSVFNMAKSVAVGNAVKQRCDENIETVQEWIDNKPERDKFKFIKNEADTITNRITEYKKKSASISDAVALINFCKPYLNELKQKLGKGDELYLNISTFVCNVVQDTIVKNVNDAMEKRNAYVKWQNMQNILNGRF